MNIISLLIILTLLITSVNAFAQSDVCNTDVPLTVRNPTSVAVRTATLDPKQLIGITLFFYQKNLPNEPIGSYTTTTVNLKDGGPSCKLVPIEPNKVPTLKKDGTEYIVDARLDANFPSDNSHQFRAMNSFFYTETIPLSTPIDVRIIP